MSVTIIDVLGHLPFALTAVSFFMRDILLLRAAAIVSSVLAAGYNYFAPEEPDWRVISWLIVFFSINVARTITLILERRNISFSEEEQELYKTIFQKFEPVEFMKLMRLGEWRTEKPGTVLATEGEELPDLKLIYNGEAAIERDGREITRVRDGTLIGEMSYLRGGTATATVRVLRSVRVVSWPRSELRSLLKRNPTMDVAMHTVFSVDLVHKLNPNSLESTVKT